MHCKPDPHVNVVFMSPPDAGVFQPRVPQPPYFGDTAWANKTTTYPHQRPEPKRALPSSAGFTRLLATACSCIAESSGLPHLHLLCYVRLLAFNRMQKMVQYASSALQVPSRWALQTATLRLVGLRFMTVLRQYTWTSEGFGRVTLPMALFGQPPPSLGRCRDSRLTLFCGLTRNHARRRACDVLTLAPPLPGRCRRSEGRVVHVATGAEHESVGSAATSRASLIHSPPCCLLRHSLLRHTDRKI